MYYNVQMFAPNLCVILLQLWQMILEHRFPFFYATSLLSQM